MARVRSRDTGPELTVRRMLHAVGFRYRLHRRGLPGTPDLVFPARKSVIFVHGCFWHAHPDPACRIARAPKSREAFWNAKFAGNRVRDERNRNNLLALGWRVALVWECELRDTAAVRDRLTAWLKEAR